MKTSYSLLIKLTAGLVLYVFAVPIFAIGADTKTANKPLTEEQKIVHYGYQAPTGYPDTAEDWVNTGALLERLNSRSRSQAIGSRKRRIYARLLTKKGLERERMDGIVSTVKWKHRQCR